MKKKPIIVRVRYGSQECIMDNGGHTVEYECSSPKDAENLIQAIDDAQGYLDYEVLS